MEGKSLQTQKNHTLYLFSVDMKLIFSKLTLSVQDEHVTDYDIITCINGISAYNETELIVVHRNSLTTSKLIICLKNHCQSHVPSSSIVISSLMA